jgi:hypothetical protein
MKHIYTNFLQIIEPTCFRLAQGLLRYGQTPFSSFLIWLSSGDWLLPGGERGEGGENYSRFRCKFGGPRLFLRFFFLVFLYENSSLIG